MRNLGHRLALEELQATFFWKIDRRETTDIATLFTQEGQLIVPDMATRMTTFLTVKGREALTRQWANRPPQLVTRHVFTNLLIEEVSPSEAIGRCISLGFRHTDPGFGAPLPVVVADHDDRYELQTDGRWRFVEKRITALFVAPSLLAGPAS